MNLVRFGPVESVRLLPEKSCVFISFLDGATAAAFHADATVKKLTLHGQELKIGWGKPSTVPSQVVQAIAMAKATRNVYLGGLDDSLTESELRDDLSRFGPIDQVKIVRDKGIGFVHFLSIGAAMKAGLIMDPSDFITWSTDVVTMISYRWCLPLPQSLLGKESESDTER
jgi:hypothetical protein